nr:hypothetical protein [Tanacetum cinerariifolium]
MTRSSNKELVAPYEELERVLQRAEEEITETRTEPTMEEYTTKTREDYGLGIVRPKFDEKAKFELKGQFLKEMSDNTFSGSDNENANKHTKRVLEVVDLFTKPDFTQDQLMLRVFPILLTEATSRWLRNESADFTVMENMDAYRDKEMGDIIFGRPFSRDACVQASQFDGFITILNGNDNVTYQMARSHPRFKHLSNKKFNKIQPVLKDSIRCILRHGYSVSTLREVLFVTYVDGGIDIFWNAI